MTTFRATFRSAVLALACAGMLGAPASVTPSFAADCFAIAQQFAAENGGQVAQADPAVRNGREVCVVVVLVPPKEGQRGKRIQRVIPAD
jgi:hypothetical protein